MTTAVAADDIPCSPLAGLHLLLFPFDQAVQAVGTVGALAAQRGWATVTAERAVPDTVRAVEPPPAGPPKDPEQWTDEQWIAWLEATDATTADDDQPVTPMGRVTHSPGGQMLGQAMLGMANALFGRNDDEVVVVVEAGSEPGDDEPFTVHLDPDHPERSSVVVRPPSRPSE